MSATSLPDPLPAPGRARPVCSVRLRLLPWRPRWRTGRDWDTGDLPGLPDGDDPISAVLALIGLVLLLPVLLAVVLGVALFSVEMLALLPLGLLLLAGRLLRLRPWVLLVTYRDGGRDTVEVVGVRALLRRRTELLARR